MRAGRFTLKKVDITENISDLTTKYHDEERLKALVRLGGLRFTRGLHHAALGVSKCPRTEVDAVTRTE